MERVFTTAAIVVVASSPARADLGDRGSTAIDGDVYFDLGHATRTGALSETHLDLGLGFHHFVAPRLAVGGAFRIGFAERGNASENDVGLSLHGGYVATITRGLYAWPRLRAGYGRQTARTGGAFPSSVQDAFSVGFQLPLVVEPATHFYLGLAPFVAWSTRADGAVEAGVSAVVGGYWGPR